MSFEIFADIDDLALQKNENWVKLPNNRYRAVRNTYVIKKTRSSRALSGPAILAGEFPADTTISSSKKISLQKKNTQVITNSIQQVSTNKWSSETTGGINGSLGIIPAKNFLGISLQEKYSEEFTKSLSCQFSDVRSYEIDINTELINSQEIKTPSTASAINKYYLYFSLWEWHYDIYIYSQEMLELSYKRQWTLKKIRETIQSGKPNIVKIPLARLILYEPQNDLTSIAMDPFTSDVEDAASIIVEPLSDPFGEANVRMQGRSLEQLAQIAFPANQAEKKLAQKLNSVTSSTKRPGQSGRTKVKKPAKKRGIQKSIPRKGAPKKVAKKSAPSRKK